MSLVLLQFLSFSDYLLTANCSKFRVCMTLYFFIVVIFGFSYFEILGLFSLKANKSQIIT